MILSAYAQVNSIKLIKTDRLPTAED